MKQQLKLDIEAMSPLQLDMCKAGRLHLTTVLAGWTVKVPGMPQLTVLLDWCRHRCQHHRHLRARYVDNRPFGTERYQLLQRIKNAVIGRDVVMVEVYPIQADEVDVTNTLHLWELPASVYVPNLKDLYSYGSGTVPKVGVSYLKPLAGNTVPYTVKHHQVPPVTSTELEDALGTTTVSKRASCPGFVTKADVDAWNAGEHTAHRAILDSIVIDGNGLRFTSTGNLYKFTYEVNITDVVCIHNTVYWSAYGKCYKSKFFIHGTEIIYSYVMELA